jgi:hypothetical protein
MAVAAIEAAKVTAEWSFCEKLEDERASVDAGKGWPWCSGSIQGCQ